MILSLLSILFIPHNALSVLVPEINESLPKAYFSSSISDSGTKSERFSRVSRMNLNHQSSEDLVPLENSGIMPQEISLRYFYFILHSIENNDADSIKHFLYIDYGLSSSQMEKFYEAAIRAQNLLAWKILIQEDALISKLSKSSIIYITKICLENDLARGFINSLAFSKNFRWRLLSHDHLTAFRLAAASDDTPWLRSILNLDHIEKHLIPMINEASKHDLEKNVRILLNRFMNEPQDAKNNPNLESSFSIAVMSKNWGSATEFLKLKNIETLISSDKLKTILLDGLDLLIIYGDTLKEFEFLHTSPNSQEKKLEVFVKTLMHSSAVNSFRKSQPIQMESFINSLNEKLKKIKSGETRNNLLLLITKME